MRGRIGDMVAIQERNSFIHAYIVWNGVKTFGYVPDEYCEEMRARKDRLVDVIEEQSKELWDLFRFTDFEMRVIMFAHEKLHEHGLHDWDFQFGKDAKRNAGYCYSWLKTIEVRRNMCRQYTMADVEDTVLHEIAHALAPPRSGHDWKWKQIALDIGCNPSRFVEGESLKVKQRRYARVNGMSV